MNQQKLTLQKYKNDMAEIIQEEEKLAGRKKLRKHAPHIDMTPMVDLMCLLITFFMLTTAFSKSKIMEIILPEPQKEDAPCSQVLRKPYSECPAWSRQ